MTENMYKLEPWVEKIEGPVLCKFKAKEGLETKELYKNGKDLYLKAFNKKYLASKITSNNGFISLFLEEIVD